MTIILQTKLEEVQPLEGTGNWPARAMFSGYSLLAAGLTTGFANLACGCVLTVLLCSGYNAVHPVRPEDHRVVGFCTLKMLCMYSASRCKQNPC